MQVSLAWVCRTELSFDLQSTEREHRKSTGKPCVDASGNLYQYDNYDEVAMDTDSEAGSPGEGSFFLCLCSLWIQPLNSALFASVPSPTHTQLHVDHAGCLPGQFGMVCSPLTLFHLELPEFFQHTFSVDQDFSQPFLSTFSTGPPPPPPLPPPADLLEAPPKPPFADEEEEEEMLLRETCLMSMVNKRVAVTEVCSRLFDFHALAGHVTALRALQGHVYNQSHSLVPVFTIVCRRGAVVPLDLQALSLPQQHSPQPEGT